MKTVYGKIENVDGDLVITPTEKGFLLDFDNVFDLDPEMPVYADSRYGQDLNLKQGDPVLVTARNIVQASMALMGLFNPPMTEPNVNKASKWILSKLEGRRLESFTYNIEALEKDDVDTEELNSVLGRYGITANEDSAFLMYTEIKDFEGVA